MAWDPSKYTVSGNNVKGNLNPKFQSPAKGSLVTSSGNTTSMPPTNPNGTQVNAVNAALNANKTRSRMQFNPAFEARVDAAFDRQRMRAEARNKKLTGFQGDIKSSFTEQSEKGSKLYEKNLALEKKLNKRFNQPVSGAGPTPKQPTTQGTTGGQGTTPQLKKKVVKPTGSKKANNMSAKQAADEERFKKIASKFYIPGQLQLSPIPGSMSSANLNIWNTKLGLSEQQKKFQEKHGTTNINEWENKNSLEDKDKTNANF